jgi:hypothetical protein
MHPRVPTGENPSFHGNVHFLAILATASRSLTMRAAEDICEVKGQLLVARGHDLSADLLERLKRRLLAKPLEACIRVDDGVTAFDIERAAVVMCQSSAFLALEVGSDFVRLRRLLRSVSLSPFASLMLSVQRAVKTESFHEAVLCSILAGTLALRDESSTLNPESAVHAGLLHDIGEMYLNPDNLGHVSGVDTDRWTEIATHPEIGMRLIKQFTACPAEVWQAVYEHHEKLDGSGYPRWLIGDALSPLGRLLSLVVTVAGILKTPDNQGVRAKLAVSFVSGEFDLQLVHAMLSPIHGSPVAEVALPASFDETVARNRARSISRCLDAAFHHVENVVLPSLAVDQMRVVVEFARQHITKLKLSWEATGIDAYFAANRRPVSSPDEDEESYLDLDVASRELKWRMRSLARHLGLMSRNLPPPMPSMLKAAISALEVESVPQEP